MWLCMRRSMASRSSVLFGIKLCAVFSLLISYHLLYQEKKTELSDARRKLKLHAFLVQRKGAILNDVITDQQLQTGIADGVLHTANSASVESVPPANRKSSIISQRAKAKRPLKFLFVLHHYEQLAKTTENLLQLAAVAKRVGRVIVEPFVRDSRMCGLPNGWFGQPRSDRRRFHELSLYFDVNFMNDLLESSHYSTMVKLDIFREECQGKLANTTLLHFMYSGQSAGEMKKLYNISKDVYWNIKTKANKTGWCACDFIDRGLDVSRRIGGIRVLRQICIDAEIFRSIGQFQIEILRRDKCVVIVHWRGLGNDRINFKPEVNLDSRKLVHSLRPSQFVLHQAYKVTHSLGEDYISVHIRSEREIQWYSVERLHQCFKVLVANVEKQKKRYNISKIFLSSDFGQFGSDTLRAFTAQNKSIVDKLRRVKQFLFKSINPVKYNPKSKNSFVADSGVVALTEMNILFGGSHLLTIGSGTFQQWIVDAFIQRKSASKEQKYWTVTRICNKEGKGSLKNS